MKLHELPTTFWVYITGDDPELGFARRTRLKVISKSTQEFRCQVVDAASIKITQDQMEEVFAQIESGEIGFGQALAMMFPEG